MRRIGFVPAMLAGFTVTCLALAPTVVRAETPANPAAAVELVRPGDAQLSCEALTREINGLANRQLAGAAPAGKAKAKRGLGFLKVLGSAAAPMLSVATGGMGGMIASQTLGAATMAGGMNAQGMADDQMASAQAMATQAMAGGSIEQQRKERLTAIFTQKGC